MWGGNEGRRRRGENLREERERWRNEELGGKIELNLEDKKWKKVDRDRQTGRRCWREEYSGGWL